MFYDRENKSLKLLADPNKLKQRVKQPIIDKFKQQLEFTHHYEFNTINYYHMKSIINDEIEIIKTLDVLINQVEINHNP